MRVRKACALLVAVSLLAGNNAPVWAYTQIPDFLCDMGEQLYLKGRPQEALYEFRKALVVEPGFARAQNYIRCIESELNVQPAKKTQDQPSSVIRIVQASPAAAASRPAPAVFSRPS